MFLLIYTILTVQRVVNYFLLQEVKYPSILAPPPSKSQAPVHSFCYMSQRARDVSQTILQAINEERDVLQKWNVRFTMRAWNRPAPNYVCKVSQEIMTSCSRMFFVKVWFIRLRAGQVSGALSSNSSFSSFSVSYTVFCSPQQRLTANALVKKNHTHDAI